MNSNPLVNAVLSFIIPGAGQYLNGSKNKAIKFLAVMVILHIAVYYLMNNPAGSAISTIYHAYAGYDAYREGKNK